LATEEKITKLSKGEKDDKEHDRKSTQILGAFAQGRRQLSHRFVKADVFEYLKIQSVQL